MSEFLDDMPINELQGVKATEAALKAWGELSVVTEVETVFTDDKDTK